MKIKARVLIGFCFAIQDTIEGVSEFRIDSRTIKRGDLEANVVILVLLGDLTHAFALGSSECYHPLENMFVKC
jgi:hypothetical protein